jgi:hypothetical protein
MSESVRTTQDTPHLFAANNDLLGGVGVLVLEDVELAPWVETHLCRHLSLR